MHGASWRISEHQGAKSKVITEAMPTILVYQSTKNQQIAAQQSKSGLSASKTPKLVATPLPPLPRKNTEKPLPRSSAAAANKQIIFVYP